MNGARPVPHRRTSRKPALECSPTHPPQLHPTKSQTLLSQHRYEYATSSPFRHGMRMPSWTGSAHTLATEPGVRWQAMQENSQGGAPAFVTRLSLCNECNASRGPVLRWVHLTASLGTSRVAHDDASGVRLCARWPLCQGRWGRGFYRPARQHTRHRTGLDARCDSRRVLAQLVYLPANDPNGRR